MQQLPRVLLKKAALGALLLLGAFSGSAFGEPPGAAYIFPAGGQRGTHVESRVGGYYFHGATRFAFPARGIQAQENLREMQTLFFNGPLILKPASQQREDYPKDYAASIRIEDNAPLGAGLCWCATAQGVTAPLKFVVGELPEVIEQEVEGPEEAFTVRFPVTVNGRIFPREDTDAWRFPARGGARVTCELSARSLGSPLQGMLEVSGPDGAPLSGVETHVSRSGDPSLSFVPAVTGLHTVRVRDAGYGGGQSYVYRLSLYDGGRVTSVFPLGGEVSKPTRVTLRRMGGGPAETIEVAPASEQGVRTVSTSEMPRGEAPGRGEFLFHASDAPEVVRHADGRCTGLVDGFVTLPSVLNGFIATPGEHHDWRLQLRANTALQAEVVASTLGSRLDSVVALFDAQGREVARNDDAVDGRPDSALNFLVPKDGEYTLRLEERFARRAGPEFAYRLKVQTGSPIQFQLRMAADFFNATRSAPPETASSESPKPATQPAKTAGLKIEVAGMLGAQNEIRLEMEGLPAGVTFEPKTIPPKAKNIEVRFQVPERTPLGLSRVRIRGVMGTGADAPACTALAGPGEQETLRFAVVPRVPFKFVGEYRVTNDQPAGTSMTRSYRLERGGFEGPLTVMLSDKQGRCLQRLTAPPLEVPAHADSFDFTVHYPTEVQLGWTSRIQLMVVGSLKDFDGAVHPISYTSFDVDDQMISVVTAGLLGVAAERTSLRAGPGTLAVPVRIRRHESLAKAPVRVHLRLPAGLRGVEAMPVDVAPGREDAMLQIRVSAGAGPFLLPAELVAQTISLAGEPVHTASQALELCPP